VAEGDIQQLLHTLIARNDAFTLSFSSYLEETDDPTTTVDAIWEGASRRTPKSERVYEIGRKLGADSVLMYVYEHHAGSSSIDERYTWQGYLFDVATEKAYQQQGDQTNLRTNTKQLLSDFVEGRKDIARHKVAILPFGPPVGFTAESELTRVLLLDAINQALDLISDVRVIYSYYDPYEEPLATGQFDGLWIGGVVNRELSNRRALQIVDSLGADIAFLCKAEPVRMYQTVGSHEHLNTEIECNLVDARRRTVYRREGVLGDASEMTTELINEYLQLAVGSL
jgi:hypothetical protein